MYHLRTRTRTVRNWYANGMQIVAPTLRLTATTCPQQNQSAYVIFIE